MLVSPREVDSESLSFAPTLQRGSFIGGDIMGWKWEILEDQVSCGQPPKKHLKMLG